MTPNNKNLLVRVLSAVVLIPLVLGLLWYSPVTTGAFLALGAGAIAYEFYAMTLQRLDPAQIFGIGVAAFLPIAWPLWPGYFSALALIGLAATTLVAFIFYLFKSPIPDAPRKTAFVALGPLYGGLLLATVSGLRQISPHGLSWVLLLLIVTWANDSCAYFAGRALGRHKLLPAISPNKTWEGFFGGMAGACVGALIASFTFFPALSPWSAIAIAIPASLLGPLGDLSESMLKRACGVKDSGQLIPGHGGALDRLDALLFTGPFVYLFATVSGIISAP